MSFISVPDFEQCFPRLEPLENQRQTKAQSTFQVVAAVLWYEFHSSNVFPTGPPCSLLPNLSDVSVLRLSTMPHLLDVRLYEISKAGSLFPQATRLLQ